MNILIWSLWWVLWVRVSNNILNYFVVCLEEYLMTQSIEEKPSVNSISQACNSVLHSKSKDETLVRIYNTVTVYIYIYCLSILIYVFFSFNSYLVIYIYIYVQANFAKWEPWHGKFGFSHPWEKYLEIGEVLRELAAIIISLQTCIQSPRQVIYYKNYI